MTKYLLAAILLSIGCTKTEEDYDALSNADFVLQTSLMNTADIDISNLAATNGVDKGVRALAQTIMAYHETAQNELKRLAIGLNLVAVDSLDAEHILLKNQLLDLSGHACDSIYIHTRVQDYHRATQLFFQEIITGQNEQLREYSQSILPQVEFYLQEADSLANNY
jgi:predicted outer membrane protein